MSRNEALFSRAQKTIPGGVNSPVRAFRSVGGAPRFFTRGEGARVWDADGPEEYRFAAVCGAADGGCLACRDALERWVDQGAQSDEHAAAIRSLRDALRRTWSGQQLLDGVRCMTVAQAISECRASGALEALTASADLTRVPRVQLEQRRDNLPDRSRR